MLSKACEYGIQVALRLAARDADGYTPVHVLSDELDLPAHYPTKVLQLLHHAGITQSLRGPNGGVALARPADEISLHEIIVAIDGEELFTQCVLGLPGCGDRKPCPLHDQWGEVRGCVHATFAETSLTELARAPDATVFWNDLLQSVATNSTAPSPNPPTTDST